MTYYSKIEFEKLSGADKEQYYDSLLAQRSHVYTAEEMDKLACAYEELETYGNSAALANELRRSAELQRKEDLRYNMERRKKGLLITVMILASFTLVATVCSIIAII
ncbi:MAG: hypothetical protein IJV70_06830 [Clostridia bacterium]|nr:hypothetical protein [Clostridia bacterium]